MGVGEGTAAVRGPPSGRRGPASGRARRHRPQHRLFDRLFLLGGELVAPARGGPEPPGAPPCRRASPTISRPRSAPRPLRRRCVPPNSPSRRPRRRREEPEAGGRDLVAALLERGGLPGVITARRRRPARPDARADAGERAAGSAGVARSRRPLARSAASGPVAAVAAARRRLGAAREFDRPAERDLDRAGQDRRRAAASAARCRLAVGGRGRPQAEPLRRSRL